jgi:GAF domain
VFLVRWLVDVTSLGKSDKESLSVEADSWQKALQTARAQRGEPASMNGFSIELLDDGCHAIDPVSRLRYDVKKAPDDPPPARSIPPRPSSAPVSPSKRPSAWLRSTTPGPGSVTEAVPAHPLPPRPVSVPPPPGPAPSAAPPQADVASSIPSQVLLKREQDATDAMPLSYREYVFVVPPGTTESAAETLLLTQVEIVRASLERVGPGKLVNLGVFDVVFEGKPPVPPLATLVWKDWRGPPIVTFPRRTQGPPTPEIPVPAAPVAPAPVTERPLAAAVVAAVPLAEPSPPEPAVVAPTPVINVAPAAILPPAPEPVLPPAEVLASSPPAPAAASAPPDLAPSSAALGAPPAVRLRVRGEDLIADLFEAMHDLHFVHDALEGGEFCLALAMEKLPSEAGLVHLYDIDRREFLVANTRGPAADKLLLQRHPENDAMLMAAMRKRRALVVADATQGDASNLARYGALGGARSVLVAPVIHHGRFLGAIELLNPLDGQPFNESEGNALTYIAEQFAEFISSHGIVTDPERIHQRHPPGT